MATIRAVYELYGFEPVETPLIEYTDALGKFLPDQDRPNEGVFSFQDDDDAMAVAALRPDRAAGPLRRRELRALPKPYRSYRCRLGVPQREARPRPLPPVHAVRRRHGRHAAASRPMPRWRMMVADTMEALGIKRGDYVIRVNNRKVLDGVLEAIGLGGDENAGQPADVLRAIDKLDRFGSDGVAPAARRRAARTRAATSPRAPGSSAAAIERVLASRHDRRGRWTGALGCRSRTLVSTARPGSSSRCRASGRARRDCERCWPRAGLRRGPHRHRSLRRARPRILHRPGLRGRAAFEIPNEDGQTVRFGSVGGGGRYDGLVSRFRGEPVPATGFSIGVSRLMAALKALGKLDASDATAAGRRAGDGQGPRSPRYQKMVASCAPPASAPRSISAAPA